MPISWKRRSTHPRSRLAGTSKRRRTKPTRQLAYCGATQISMAWFLNLPEKALKLHFSQEEQTLLAHRSVIPDVADRALHRRKARSKLNTSSTQPAPKPPSHNFTFFDEALNASIASELGSLAVPSLPFKPSVTASRPIAETWKANLVFSMEDRRPHETFFDDSHDDPIPQTDLALERKPRSRRSSIRRAVSLILDNTASNTNQVTPHRPAAPNLRLSQRKSWPHPKGTSATSVYHTQSPSQYYQDPEARMKLKIYLASPQKFQEVLEYGFPSFTSSEAERPNVERLSFAADRASNDAQTFLRNNTLSFLDNDDEDEDERSGFSDAAESYDASIDDDKFTLGNHSLVRHSNTYKFEPTTKLLSRPSRGSSSLHRPSHDRHLPRWNGSREMTLRMTLTKPEFRDPEENLDGWQARPLALHDPLALQELPQVLNDLHDSMPFRTTHGKGKARSLWKKMKQGGTTT